MKKLRDLTEVLRAPNHGHFGPGFGNIGAVSLRLIASAPADAKAQWIALEKAASYKLADDEVLVIAQSYDAGCALSGHKTQHKGGVGFAAYVATKVAARPAATARSRASLAPRKGARAAHVARIDACLKDIVDGVCYQANLAHALDVKGQGDPAAFYVASLENAPAFSAYLPLPGQTLVSLSPECFFTMADGVLVARPIKGTRPRGQTPSEDKALAQELLHSNKDRAEHIMIVDLMRNDLSRICEQVSVRELMALLSVENVHHLESYVEGRCKTGTSLTDILTALAPGGSITGAPKSSACETIARLESEARGFYTGCLGVVDKQGTGAFSLLIRTMVVDGIATLHVGGGIVADSNAEDEWQETLDKARGFGTISL